MGQGHTKFIFVLLMVTFSLPIQAWVRMNVPGAQCGDGSDYYIYIKQGHPRKLAFMLMGGGACWDFESCWGVSRRAWIHSIPVMPDVGGITSSQSKGKLTPVGDYTKVFFPYCTGDVHLGEHIAHYGNRKVHHVGKLNIERGYQFLVKQGLIDFKYNDQFLMYGYSAGAIGSLYHFNEVDKLLPRSSDKILVADAPGLHFGETFWQKFPEKWVADIDHALEVIGYQRDPWDGLMAPIIEDVCNGHRDWRFYFLQGSQDIVMSKVFGEISQAKHREKVFGDRGMSRLTLDAKDNCSSWIPETEVHTFLATDQTASSVMAGGINALEFLTRAIQRAPQINYQ